MLSRPRPVLDRESVHLGVARSLYLGGTISVETFEEYVGQILRGEPIVDNFGLGIPPIPSRPAEPTYR